MRFPVILASASPRRQELLRQIVPIFSVIPADLDEASFTDADPWMTAQRLAKEKCLVVSAENPDALVIGGDTVVGLIESEAWCQLAKPLDFEDAVAMLTRLQGATHTVVTGVALRWPGGLSVFTESSEVTFRPVGEDEIRAYVATGDPMDKAGGYGLQSGANQFIATVKGDIDTVIGLPVGRLREALQWASSPK